jgi:hypothetical protein
MSIVREVEARGPEYRYTNLLTLASLTVPYIVLMNSLDPAVNEYRFGDVEVILRPAPGVPLARSVLRAANTRFQ